MNPSTTTSTVAASSSNDLSRNVAIAAAASFSAFESLHNLPGDVSLAPSASPPLNFSRILSILLTRVASGGVEGISLSSLFSALEAAERLRLCEESLVTGQHDPEVVNVWQTTLDPFTRFHIIKLVREASDVEIYIKPPQSAAAAAIPSYSAATAALPPSIMHDPDDQLKYVRSILRDQPLNALPQPALPTAAPTQHTDQLLDESVAGKNTWMYTGQGLLHITSLQRVKLLPQTLHSLTPEEYHLLGANIILVASLRRRCQYLGVTEDDVAGLKPFTAPSGKGSTATAPLPAAVAHYGTAFLLFNMLETIGKYSIQMLNRPTVLDEASAHAIELLGTGASKSSHIPAVPAGLLQLHISKILRLSSANTYRFLLILESRGMITPIKVTDDITTGSSCAPWRWFLTHFSPSLHAAARSHASFSASTTPFASLGAMSSDTPLQSFQSAIQSIQQFYRKTNWKNLRRKIKVEKEKELERFKKAGKLENVNLKPAEQNGDRMEIDGEANTTATAASSPSAAAGAAAASSVKMEDGSEDSRSNPASSNAAFPLIRIESQMDVDQLSAPPPSFILNSPVTHQIYRLLVARGTRGATMVDMRTHFHSFYSVKFLHAQVQILIKQFDVKSIADQTGKTMAFRFFTSEAFEEFKQQFSMVDMTTTATVRAPVNNKNKKSKAKSEAKEKKQDTSLPTTSSPIVIDASTSPSASPPSSTPPPTATATTAAPSLPAADEDDNDDEPPPLAPLKTQLQIARTAPAVGKERETLQTMQRDAWALNALRAAPHLMLRSIDISRMIVEKEAALQGDGTTSSKPKVTNGEEITSLDQKILTRMWARLEAAGKVRQLTISVPLQHGEANKNILVIVLQEGEPVDEQLTKERAIELAKQDMRTEKQKQIIGRHSMTRTKATTPRKRKVKEISAKDESESEMDEEEYKMKMEREAEEAHAAAVLGIVVTPKKKTQRKSKHDTPSPKVKKPPPMLRLRSLTGPRKRRRSTTAADSSNRPVASVHHDPEHIPQPFDVPFRRSTSQEEQKHDGDQDEDEEDEEMAKVTKGGRNNMTDSPKKKREKSTRIRWTPEEDQRLIQIANQYFAQYYPPARDGAAIAPAVEVDETGAPMPIPSVNVYSATHMRRLGNPTLRDSAACRRRLEILRQKGLLPVIVAAGTGPTSIRMLGFTHLARDIFSNPLHTSLLHFMQMIFSHPPDHTYAGDPVRAMISHYTEAEIEVILKALRADKWITQAKYNENQTGRGWKFSAGWQDLLKPQHTSAEIFQVLREFIAPFNHLATSNNILSPSKSAASAASDTHKFTLDINAHGGDVAAIFHLIQSGEVDVHPRIQETKKHDTVVVVDVESVPQLRTWTENEAAVAATSSHADDFELDALISATPLSRTFLSMQLDQPFSSLTKVDINAESLLDEKWLIPGGLGQEETEEKVVEDVVMSDVIPNTTPSITAASTAVPATASSSSSHSSISNPSSWLDTPEVVYAQHQIESLVDKAGKEGIEWSYLYMLYNASNGQADAVLPPRSSSLTVASSLFEKALARGLNYLRVIRVMVRDTNERYVSSLFSGYWVVPTFDEKTGEPDFTHTAILPHPWRNISGEINRDRYEAFIDALLSLLLHFPGMTTQALLRKFPLLTPAELEQVLQQLRMEGRISEMSYETEVPSLFSQPCGGMEEESGNGKKARKRRKTKHVTLPRFLVRSLL